MATIWEAEGALIQRVSKSCLLQGSRVTSSRSTIAQKVGSHFLRLEKQSYLSSLLELLEAQEIMPRSPSPYHTPRSVSPSQLEANTGAEASDDEDIDVLAVRMSLEIHGVF